MIHNTNHEIRSVVKMLQWIQDTGENNLRKLRSIKREVGKVKQGDWNLLYYSWLSSAIQYFEDNKLLENQIWRINNIFYVCTSIFVITPWDYKVSMWKFKKRINTIQKIKGEINKLETPELSVGFWGEIWGWINRNVINELVASVIILFLGYILWRLTGLKFPNF